MLSGTVGGFKMLNSEKIEKLGPKILNSISVSTLALMAVLRS